MGEFLTIGQAITLAGAAAAVAFGAGAILVWYFSDKSAIIDKLNEMADTQGREFNSKLEAHRNYVSNQVAEVHKRIERVEKRAEDRLSSKISDLRAELHNGMKDLRQEMRDGFALMIRAIRGEHDDS